MGKGRSVLEVKSEDKGMFIGDCDLGREEGIKKSSRKLVGCDKKLLLGEKAEASF